MAKKDKKVQEEQEIVKEEVNNVEEVEDTSEKGE